MSDLVFFYGTLMSGFRREERAELNDQLKSVGGGSIAAALFDLGAYPAAIPARHSRVRGELHQMLDVDHVLALLDEIEGCRLNDRLASLYTREETAVRLDDGLLVSAWVYFYNAPLGDSPRIASGDYLDYLKAR